MLQRIMVHDYLECLRIGKGCVNVWSSTIYMTQGSYCLKLLYACMLFFQQWSTVLSRSPCLSFMRQMLGLSRPRHACFTAATRVPTPAPEHPPIAALPCIVNDPDLHILFWTPKKLDASQFLHLSFSFGLVWIRLKLILLVPRPVIMNGSPNKPLIMQ